MNSNPTPYTPAQRERDIARLQDAIHALERAPVETPCTHCELFEPASGHCLQWKQTVPETARAVGCAHWIEAAPF